MAGDFNRLRDFLADKSNFEKIRGGVFLASPDGRDIRLSIDGSAVGTPVGEDSDLVVLPDGTTMIFNYGGVARIFAPDGTARFISEKAREDDADRARKRAERDE